MILSQHARGEAIVERQRSLHDRLYVPLERGPSLQRSVLDILGYALGVVILGTFLAALFTLPAVLWG